MQRSLLILSLILVAVLGAQAQVTAKDEAAVRETVEQMVRAQTSYDAKALDAILAADYIEISPIGEFDPREKVIGFYTPEAKASAAGMSAQVKTADHSVRIYEKHAVAIVRLDYAMTMNGNAMPPRSMRATFVLSRSGNGWKIASAHYTGIRQPPPSSK
jgi:uncharacterized protein (TIGR02246 family)